MSRIDLRAVTFAAMAASALLAHAPQARAQEQMDGPTRAILDSLRVNDVRGAMPERPTKLAPNTAEDFGMVIGGARLVDLPGSFDKATTVIPEVADVNVLAPGRVQIVARKEGSTDIVFTDQSGSSYKLHVTVTLNAAPIQAAIDAALPGERILATAINGSIVLSGSTRDATAATTAAAVARRFVSNPENVVNSIQVMGGQQVLLRVRVSEVSRTIVKQLGLDTAVGKAPNAVFGSSPGLAAYGYGAAPGDSALGLPANAGGGPNLTALGAVANPVGYISTKALGGVFTAVASALESQGLVRTLASPDLVAQSGKTASMLAGSQYPVPQVSQSGTTGTEYRNFGVSLAFTPTVLSPNSIGLDIATEVSTLGQNVTFPGSNGGSFNVPIFNTRKASTTVELPSGGSIVIAGLVSSDFENTLSGIPGLKDMPILGKLFSSANFQHNESELVISVTAYLVQPTDAAAVAGPTDALPPPSDLDLYVLNRLTGVASRRLASPPRGIERAFGYITE
jgi:pilus assembly protein CpaC